MILFPCKLLQYAWVTCGLPGQFFPRERVRVKIHTMQITTLELVVNSYLTRENRIVDYERQQAVFFF